MLTIVSSPFKQDGVFYIECVCDCGSNNVRRLYNLLYAKPERRISCGCLRKEIAFKHGYTIKNSRLYSIWRGIKQRCLNEKDPAFENYGARGVTICSEWSNDFMAFRKWALNNGYEENLAIDRINNDGHYEPNNCRWTDYTTQNRNKRNNRILTYLGETKTLVEWSEDARCKFSYQVLVNRLHSGWGVEEVFGTPLRVRQDYTIYSEAFGERKTLGEWAKDARCSVTYNKLYDRVVRNGWALERAMTQK